MEATAGAQRVTELAGEPLVAELADLLNRQGLAQTAKQFGIQTAELERIRKQYDIGLMFR